MLSSFLRVLPFVLIAAMATTAPATASEQHMVKDVDENGSYSLAELQVVFSNLTEAAFVALDGDESGELSADELDAALKSGALK